MQFRVHRMIYCVIVFMPRNEGWLKKYISTIQGKRAKLILFFILVGPASFDTTPRNTQFRTVLKSPDTFVDNPRLNVIQTGLFFEWESFHYRERVIFGTRGVQFLFGWLVCFRFRSCGSVVEVTTDYGRMNVNIVSGPR